MDRRHSYVSPLGQKHSAKLCVPILLNQPVRSNLSCCLEGRLLPCPQFWCKER